VARTLCADCEHTSYTYQGHMEGAVKSGERAAMEIIAARS
jgi:monoamine oxidase